MATEVNRICDFCLVVARAVFIACGIKDHFETIFATFPSPIHCQKFIQIQFQKDNKNFSQDSSHI